MNAWIDRITGWLLGVVVLVAGLVFAASLAVAALFVGALALLTRPLRQARAPLERRRARPADVVDIEEREVPTRRDDRP